MAMAKEVTRKVADGKKVSVNASAGYLWKTDLLIIRKKKKYFFHPKKRKTDLLTPLTCLCAS